MPRAPGGCHSGRVLVKTSYRNEKPVTNQRRLRSERGRSYLAEVHDWSQVEDILDQRLGTIERWRLEESYTLGHVVDEPNS